MNRPLYALFGLGILILYCFVMFQKSLNGSDTLLSAYIGIAGALFGAALGGIFSGYYSYHGGMKAAERNYELLRSLASEEKKNIIDEHSRQLFAQLRFSYDLIVNSTNWVPISGLIYDNEWYKHLAAIDYLDQDEKQVITNWFHEIIMCQKNLEFDLRQGSFEESPLKCMLYQKIGNLNADVARERFVNLLPSIKTIIKKHN
jgi:hypothetical protein